MAYDQEYYDSSFDGRAFNRREAEYYRDRDNAQRAREVPFECSIEAVFRIARHNPTVQTMLTHWRAGRMTLENVLIGMVTSLAEQNAKLMRVHTEELYRCRKTIKIPEPTSVTPQEFRAEQDRKRADEKMQFYNAALGVPHEIDDQTKLQLMKNGWADAVPKLPKELMPPEADHPLIVTH